MALDFPATPTVGQQFGSGTTTWVFDGTAWNIMPQLSPAVASDLPPSNPAVGQLWWRSTNGKLYIYTDDGNSKQWVETGNAGATPGAWETIYNDVVSGITSYNRYNLGAYDILRLTGTLHPDTTATQVTLYVTSNNGASLDQWRYRLLLPEQLRPRDCGGGWQWISWFSTSLRRQSSACRA